MDIQFGPGDLALLAAMVSPDPLKQADWILKAIRKALNRQPSADLLKEFTDDFWPNYPRKVAVGAARTSYMRARAKTDASTILNGLAHYRASLQAGETKFIAHASTWLNQERWNDERQPLQGEAPKLTNDPHYAARQKIEHFLKTGRWIFGGRPPTAIDTLFPVELLKQYQERFAAKGMLIEALS